MLGGSLPVMVGATSALLLGGESMIISQTGVEVAQDASTIEPVVQDALDGLVLWVRPARAIDGGLSCAVGAWAHVLAGPMVELLVGAPLYMPLDRGEWDTLTVDDLALFGGAGGARKVTYGGAGGLILEIELR